MFSLISNRFGRLIPAFVLFPQVGVLFAVEARYGYGYFGGHPWTWAPGLFISAAVCWLFGRALRRRELPPCTDPNTGGEPMPGTAAYARYAMREIDKEAEGGPRDSLFGLHVIYWGPILAVAGCIALLVGWLR